MACFATVDVVALAGLEPTTLLLEVQRFFHLSNAGWSQSKKQKQQNPEQQQKHQQLDIFFSHFYSISQLPLTITVSVVYQ